MTITTPTAAATLLDQLATSRKLGEEHRANRGFLVDFFWACVDPARPEKERIAPKLAKGEYDADTLIGWARELRGEV